MCIVSCSTPFLACSAVPLCFPSDNGEDTDPSDNPGLSLEILFKHDYTQKHDHCQKSINC